MPAESFFETMIIDTSEAAANLESLVESGIFWKHNGSKFNEMTDEDFSRLKSRLENQ